MEIKNNPLSEYEFTENTNSITIKKREHYILRGFNTVEEINEWIEGLPDEQKCINHEGIILNSVVTEYGVTILESEIATLTQEERKRVINCPKTTNITPYMPWTYRYIDEEYVDRFFENGELRLCTFESCSKLEDSQRKDCGEGTAIIVGETSIKNLCIMGSSGENNLMLCTSLSSRCVNDKGKLYESGIIIKDVFGFMMVIKEALERDGLFVENMLMGPCNYTNNKRINRKIPDEVVKNMLDHNTVNLNDVAETFFRAGQNDIFFRKLSDKANEHEYRMLWLTDRKMMEDHYTVHIPNAIQFCEKFKISED